MALPAFPGRGVAPHLPFPNPLPGIGFPLIPACGAPPRRASDDSTGRTCRKIHWHQGGGLGKPKSQDGTGLPLPTASRLRGKGAVWFLFGFL